VVPLLQGLQGIFATLSMMWGSFGGGHATGKLWRKISVLSLALKGLIMGVCGRSQPRLHVRGTQLSRSMRSLDISTPTPADDISPPPHLPPCAVMYANEKVIYITAAGRHNMTCSQASSVSRRNNY